MSDMGVFSIEGRCKDLQGYGSAVRGDIGMYGVYKIYRWGPKYIQQMESQTENDMDTGLLQGGYRHSRDLSNGNGVWQCFLL